MPKFRQLHTKIIDSFDFNEMPSDFCRLTWVLLPVIADSEGRCIDDMAWLRSKIYPLRSDVELEELSQVFEWFSQRGMIERYQANGRHYFWIPNFKKYQYGTNKEAKSVIPAPPEGSDHSGVSPELPRSSSVPYVYESAYESVNVSESESVDLPSEVTEVGKLEGAFITATKLHIDPTPKAMMVYQSMVKNGITPADIEASVKLLDEKGYTIVGPWSIEKTAITEARKRQGKDHKLDNRRYITGEYAEFVEH